MKKIGIVTFWDSEDNYGQLLQCFALSYFLKKIGCDPKLIKADICVRTTLFHKVITFLLAMKSPSKLKSIILKKRLGKKAKSINIRHPRYFNVFRDKHIPSTEIIPISRIYSAPPLFDVYIAGSDQVWNSLSPLYFLKFAPKGTKKIAYAASMGGYKPYGKELSILKNYVKDFDYVSLREKQAIEFFKQNNICKADYVPDPTLLLMKDDYKKLYEDRKNRPPYILLYLLGNKLQFNADEIYQFAKKKNLDIVYVASQGRSDEYEKVFPTIEEWLNLVENAEIVITNSFHGTVFSMIYRKKFTTLLLNGVFAKMNDRITDMLEKYGLGNRIFSGSIEECENEVDYSSFEQIVNSEREYVKNKFIEVVG